MASKQIRRLSSTCSDAQNPDRPWEGYWQASKDDATLTLEIGERSVRGDFDVRGRKYPVAGTVDDAGYVSALMEPAPGVSGGYGKLNGIFPEIRIESVGSSGMGQKLALYQGKAYRVCE